MRGHLSAAKRHLPSDSQNRFRALSRSRRAKVAKAAGTSLVKAHQWARGAAVEAAIATSLETQVAKLPAPKK